MTIKMDLEALKKLATTLRVLAAEGVEKANSGHPGLPMGAADYAAVLWSYYLQFNPADPAWPNRDRFVLSAGHGSMLLYALLHLFGYDLPMSELKSFRQWGSRTPGHPEFGLTPGVEATTGPLGQGFANGVGMALSGKLLGARYAAGLFSHRVFGLVSDGDLMEGVASEAASLAGHLKLGNLIYLYDDNHISLADATDVCFSEDVAGRFTAYGWYVQKVDGHDFEAVSAAIENALGQEQRPSLICARTIIGKGSPHKADTSEAHGAPLGAEELKETLAALGWKEPPFSVPTEVAKFCAGRVEQKRIIYNKWRDDYRAWRGQNPDLANGLDKHAGREASPALKQDLLTAFTPPKKDATRNMSGLALQVLARHLPNFIGGSADLEPSTKTLIKGSPNIEADSFAGKNIRFGVREFAMGGVANGLAYTRQWIPYTATFLVFSDYMRHALRLAALSHIQTLFIFTHDSFYVGEDGPTHQPIEQLAGLRLIPNLLVFRPADGLEVAMCYLAALRHTHGPSALIFTRQNVMPIPRKDSFDADDILRGAYIASGHEVSSLVIVATGSEVGLALEAAKLLEASGRPARVVSMPCVELFEAQSREWRDQLIPRGSQRVAVEAGRTLGWERVVGSDALLIGRDDFGASAPAEVLAREFGFTAESVAERIRWHGVKEM